VDSPTGVAGRNPVSRREATKHAAAAGFVLLFVICQQAAAPASALIHWGTDLAWTLASLLAGAECLRAARGLSGDQRRAWLFFAAGCLAWLAGMLFWDYRELVQREITPFPDYSDLGFLALPPLYVFGFIYISTRRGVSLTLKDIADLGTIVALAIFGCWLALADQLSTSEHTPVYRTFAVAFPVLHASALVFALLTLLRHPADTGRAVLALFFGSLALHTVTDFFYARSLLEATYEAGHYLDVFWIIAFAMIYSAAVIQQHRGTERVDEGLHEFNLRMRRADTLVLSAVILLVGIVSYWNRDAIVLQSGILAPFLLALALFLGLREWANHRIQLQLIAEIRASERELNRILDHLDDTYYRTDNDGIYRRVSSSASRLIGYTPAELVGRDAGDFSADAGDRERMLAALESNGGVLRNYESQLVRKDGSRIWVWTNLHYIHDQAGNVVGLEGTSRDVSDIKAAEEDMRKLSGALRQSADAVMITNREGVIEYVNPAFEETTNYPAEDVVGRNPRILNSGEHDKSYYDALWRTILAGEVFRDVMVNRRRDGSLYYEDKTITPLMDDAGSITHFVSNGKDISEQIQARERLQYIAHHDTLTGMPNRTLFLDRAQQVLVRARRHQRLAAGVFLDLDQFKNINDSLGHEVGDKLLVGVAGRLSSHLRSGDTVARFGGDEFVVLLDDVSSYSDITSVVEKLRRALHTPIAVDGISLHVTVTAGISVFPHDGDDGPALLKHADNAMYRAKEYGRDTYTFYSEEMSTRAHQRLSMENRLRRAVDNHEFEVFYQPQVDIVDNSVLGVEALLRWREPGDDEEVGPAAFVPLLEDTGLILPVGDEVLRTACEQVHDWNNRLGRRLEVAVNISARQFTNTRFPDIVREIVDEAGLEPCLLQLEMTESVYLRTTGAGATTVQQLDEAGIRLAIDDFGTGYSALNYLKRLPLHVLKIDRSFIQDIPDAADDAALTVAALAMARGLDLRVVAEGVETRAQRDFLRENGCRYVQGFLFSAPVPAGDLEALLTDPAFPASRVGE